MGSTLSVQNNTDDKYSIKIGPDQAAVLIATAVMGVVAAMGTAGAASGLFAGIELSILGSTITATVVVNAASTIISGTAAAIKFAEQVHEYLTNSGYITVNAHDEWTSWKMSLSLWQQCEAIRVRVDGDYAIFERVWMRPIFSGSTDSSNNKHEIQWWINKWGHQEISRVKFEIIKQD